jgi:electron transfer flavoprotein alpha subunit
VSNILIYGETTKLAKELLSAARVIGGQVYGVSINNDEQAQALGACGANMLRINNSELFLADTAAVACVLQQAAENIDADTVLLTSNRSGKELAGRVAQLLQGGCLTDVNKLNINNGRVECTRNALGGATVAVQVIKTDRKIIAISPKSFDTAEEGAAGTVTDWKLELDSSYIKVLEVKEKAVESVNIESVELLIAIGQGVDDQSQLALVQDIAQAIGGEVACSKPVATDKKWLSEERIIGISGKICKPTVAILLGISGQVQFSVGIRDAKTIISVNNDENALICDMSDYVLIADLQEAIPELKNAVA